MDKKPLLYTYEDVAGRLSLTIGRVRSLAKDGTLPVVKLGRSVRIHAAKFDAWLARGGTGGAA